MALYSIVACVVTLLILPVSAVAHPHGWIDLRTAVIFDTQGRITALRVLWTFDEFYSVFATEGMDKDGDGAPDNTPLQALAMESMTGLAEFSYFTFMEVAGKPISYAKATDYESTFFQGRLGLVFTLPLNEPIDPRKHKLVYRAYDPTYYIEVLHIEDRPVLFEGAAPKGCTFNIETPKPNMQTLALAQSLDQTESGGDGLGRNFAEKVTIHCP